MATTYVKDETGATFIPATQRPDGTWRKARRVKDGYVPQEEVPLYESKGKQWAKSRPSLPPGLSQEQAETVSKPKEVVNNVVLPVGLSKAAKKNAKRKEKKKQAQNSEHDETGKLSENLSEMQIVESKKDEQGNKSVVTDPVKRLKNLRKKLRDIDNLKLKIESGELQNPDKDQLEKIKRREQVEREIEDLELMVDDDRDT